ncbi:MAG TPA: hypothetical protein PLW09_15585, partial [Candidatus Kapabacteria bacterium]|nr:hypothetical protein [Candidatus Kapabacteria bacterium]
RSDQEFVKNQVNVVNGYIERRDDEVIKSPVTFLTSAKAAFVGTLIGIATAIKSLPYPFQSAVSKLKSDITPSF